MPRPPSGIITVLNTPFYENNEVALDALAQHARAALASGVAGFLVPAMAAEVGKLTAAERLAMMQCVVTECRDWNTKQRHIATHNEVHVIGGCTAGVTSLEMSAADHARAAVAAGCDGVNVAVSYTGDDEQYEAEVRAVAVEVPADKVHRAWIVAVGD